MRKSILFLPIATGALVFAISPSAAVAVPPTHGVSVDGFEVTSAAPGGVDAGYCWATFTVTGEKPGGVLFAGVTAQGPASSDGTDVRVAGRPGVFTDTGRLLVASTDPVIYTVTLTNRAHTDTDTQTFGPYAVTC